MAFLNDKILEGESVILRHVTPADAEAILAAWHADDEDISFFNRFRIASAKAFLWIASRLHPFAQAKFRGPQVSSTWRHHRPPNLQQEREILRRLEKNDDRYQYLMTRKETSEIIGCVGFKTNCAQKDGLTNDCLENLRVARLGMLLFREDPWDHRCEREAISLMLKTIFGQDFRKRDGSRFRIIDVVVPVNEDDEVTVGVLVSLGFRPSTESYVYHDRVTRLFEYFPKDIDPSKC